MGINYTHRPILRDYIKDDNLDDFIKTLKQVVHPLQKNEELESGKSTIVLCAYYNSKKCMQYLINQGHDINYPDQLRDKDTPFIIACKFDNMDCVKLLLENHCDVNKLNEKGLNALDVSIIRGNYKICLYLIQHTELQIKKPLEYYKALNEHFNYPLFNMELFYQCLVDKVPADQIPSFKVESERKKRFEGKMPDPNETWQHFFWRLAKFELYEPPLVDKPENQNNQKQSMYMRMQTGLCQMAYGQYMSPNEEVKVENSPYKENNNAGNEGSEEHLEDKDNKYKSIELVQKENENNDNIYNIQKIQISKDTEKINEKEDIINKENDNEN